MTNQNKVNGLLGFAAKAGKIVAGTDAVIDSIEFKKAKIVIVAENASDKTKKNIKYICDKNRIDFFVFGNIDDLSKSIGKVNKAEILKKLPLR